MYITITNKDEVYVYPLLPEHQWHLVIKMDVSRVPAIYLSNEQGEILLSHGDSLRAIWPTKQIADIDMAICYGAIAREMAERMAAGATCIDMDSITDEVLSRFWEQWGNAQDVRNACESICH